MRVSPSRPWPRPLVGALVLATFASSCAIVDSVTEGLAFVGRYANGIVRGEGELPRDVAHRVEAGHRGLQLLVRLDETALPELHVMTF